MEKSPKDIKTVYTYQPNGGGKWNTSKYLIRKGKEKKKCTEEAG